MSILVLVLKILQYFLDYISYFFYSFLMIESFAICMMIVIDSGFEQQFIKLFFNIFPTNFGLESGTFSVGSKEILQIMALWNLVVMVLGKILGKIIKVKINRIVYFVAFTLLHIVAIIRLWNVSGAWSSIAFFYFNSIVGYFIFLGIKKGVKAVQRLIEWYCD